MSSSNFTSNGFGSPAKSNGNFSSLPSSPPNWGKKASHGNDSNASGGWGGTTDHVPVTAFDASGGRKDSGMYSANAWQNNKSSWGNDGGRASAGSGPSSTYSSAATTGFQSVNDTTWSSTPNTGNSMLGDMGTMSGDMAQGNETTSASAPSAYGVPGTLDGEDPPLLEELGIRPDHMMKKTIAVLLPYQRISHELAHDSDMAGPVAICLAFGFLLLIASGGEMHFSAIYSFFLFGSIGIYMVLNLMAQAESIDILRVFSVLGYCLLPIVLLAAVAVIFEIHTRWWASLIAVFCIVWSTLTSTRFFEAGLKCREQRYLIAYPVFLLYSCFALITVF